MWVWAFLLLLFAAAPPAGASPHLRLATTTSTENTGLLDVLLPPFEQRFALKVDVIAVGSGKALKLAENGDVDVVLSHAPELEKAFVAAGFGVNRRHVMYNDFVLVGPAADPAGVRHASSASDALARVAAKRALFVSRGDESGTHQKEKLLWQAAGLRPGGQWYLSAGSGMGQVLRLAGERRAYTLADRGTYLRYKKREELTLLYEGDPALFNPYVVIAVNPARYPGIKYLEAMELIAWLTSPAGQECIERFRLEGEALFHPAATAGP